MGGRCHIAASSNHRQLHELSPHLGIMSLSIGPLPSHAEIFRFSEPLILKEQQGASEIVNVCCVSSLTLFVVSYVSRVFCGSSGCGASVESSSISMRVRNVSLTPTQWYTRFLRSMEASACSTILSVPANVSIQPGAFSLTTALR